MPRRYPAEFRRRALDLVREGRPVSEVAAQLGIGHQTLYDWRRQDRIDRGEAPGASSAEKAELVAARRRIAQLEAELAATRRAQELLRDVVPPKGSSRGGDHDRRGSRGPHLPHGARCLAFGLLRVAPSAAIGSFGPSCLADRRHHQGPRRVLRHLRRTPGSRRTGARPRHRRRSQHRGHADAAGRPPRSAGPPPTSMAAPGPDGRGSGRPAVRPDRARPSLGDRHHRTPALPDAPSTR